MPSSPARPIRDAIYFVCDAPRLIVGTSILLFCLDALVCAVSRLALIGVAMFVTSMLLRLVVRAWLRPGFLRALDDARRGGDAPSVDALGSGLDRFGSMIVATLVGDVISVLSFAVGALPGLALISYATRHDLAVAHLAGVALSAMGSMLAYLYTWLGLRFAEHAIALEDLGPFAALGRAWRIASGRRIAIMSVILFSAAIELASLVWGLVSFGVGVFVSIPMARMVSDHALVTSFVELARDLDVRVRVKHHNNAYAWRTSFVGVRGAALPEYALLLVAILLMAAGAFKNLGGRISSAADRTGTAFLSGAGAAGGAGAGGAGAAGAGAAADGESHGILGFLGDVVKGGVLGDFSEGSSAGKLVGQTLVSFIPIVGQIAAARDIAAAAIDIAHGKPGGFAELGIAALGVVPGLGPELKSAAKAASATEKIAAREGLTLLKDGAKSGAEATEAAVVAAAKKEARDAELKVIYAKAGDSKKEIDALADRVAAEHGGAVAKAPLKSTDRVIEKADKEYGGDLGRVKDVARNTVVVKSGDEAGALKSLREMNPNIADKDVKIVEANKDPLGYSGTNVSVPTKNGARAEVQINSPEMIYAKEKPADARNILGNEKYDQIASRPGIPEGGKGHSLYESYRSSADPAAKESIAAESRQYYDAVRAASRTK